MTDVEPDPATDVLILQDAALRIGNRIAQSQQDALAKLKAQLTQDQE